MGPGPEARLADRRKLLLGIGAPYGLLLLSSLAAWPWRTLDLPGVIGALTPPSFLLLAAAVGGAAYALRRRLPLSMITWLPAGQGAIVLLATGFFAAGAQDQLTGLAFIIAYGFIFLIVLGITTAVAAHGAPIAIAFISFFLFTQAARFPIFAVDGAAPAVGASWLTLAAAARATGEVLLMAWLARRLVEAADASATRSALLIVGLVVAHGFLASWEDPVLRGSPTFADAAEQVVRWLLFTGIQLGMAAVLIRFRRAQFREQDPPQPAAFEAGPTAPEEASPPPATPATPPPRHRRRPTPPRRRRR